jgi:hypothetical protein
MNRECFDLDNYSIAAALFAIAAIGGQTPLRVTVRTDQPIAEGLRIIPRAVRLRALNATTNELEITDTDNIRYVFTGTIHMAREDS